MTSEQPRCLLTGLDHVQVAIPPGREDVARDFWVTVLGLRERAKPPSLAARGGAWFESPGVVVHVGSDAAFVPATKAHPAFRVDDIDRLADELSAAGFPVRWDDEIPGVRRFHSADPFGNRLEFVNA